MPLRPFPFRLSLPAVRLRWMALALLLLSLLVHLTVLEWVKSELTLPTFDDEADQVISITLQASPPVSRAPRATVRQPVAVPATPAEVPAVPPTPAMAPTAEISPPATPDAGSAAVANPVAPAAPAAKAEASGQHEAMAAPAAETNLQPPLFERVSLPPAANLGYSVTAFKDGRKIEGQGTISWLPGPTHYEISGEAGVLFFTVLSYKSSGTVDALGIAPELYVEKRFSKPETNTHFHRERKQISFSASTNAYPSKGGEQDRASVIWQIAALGRGDGEKFVPGLVFELFVAGTRTAADWRVYVNGMETVDVAGSPTPAWHLSLLPVERSYEQQFELWLAPQKEWYPVRLRYAGSSESYLDMRVTKIEMRK